MDKVGRLYERKKFLKILFNDLSEEEYIRIFLNKDDFKKVTFWKNIDSLNDYIENNRYNANAYFNLSTTNGISGETENLQYAYCLAWDFDKKQLNGLDSKEIMFKFNKQKLYYHALIDSGHGYHAYMCINKTNDLKKVEEVTKAIGALLGADPDAMLQTQILRVPYTFNFKDEKPKQVNIIKQYPKETIRRYKIEDLYKRFCNKPADDRTIKFVTSQTRFPPCIINILKGVSDGNRNFSLLRLVSFLKLYRYNKAQSWNVIKEWNLKNETPEKDVELEYQFNYNWDKQYTCCGCTTQDAGLQAQISQYCNKEECRSSKKNDVVFVEGNTIVMEHKICQKVEKKRDDIFQLKGNHLLILGILKNNREGLNTEQIINEISNDGKCCLGNKTLSNTLKELTDNNFITKVAGNKRKKEKDFYKINEIKCEEMEKFNLSYFTILGVIEGKITTEDFKIYCYMRYRLNKGLSLSQIRLADELGVGQSVISKHIKKLIDKKYIKFKGIEYKNNIFGNNEYELNY